MSASPRTSGRAAWAPSPTRWCVRSVPAWPGATDRPGSMITDVAGLRVGHWTDPEARTGCTVVLFPDGTVASGDVRGGAPATRELELLDPRRTVSRIDAVVLTGGSAFGPAAADRAQPFRAALG